MTPVHARTRRRAAGLAVSLGIHGALLLAFMSVTPRLVTVPRLPSPPEPVVELELSPRSTAPASASGAPRHAKPPAAVTSALAPRAFAPHPAPAAPSARRDAAPAAAAAVAGAGPAGVAATRSLGDGRWRVQGGGEADAAARALIRGTVGCGAAEYLHLTADERDHCNAEFVRGMRTLRVDGLPAGKRAYYDEVIARTEAARGTEPFDALHRRQLMEQRRDHGLDMAFEFKCGVRFGPGAVRANRDNPCRPGLPLSPLTAETRVPPPPTLADQTADARAAARFDPPSPQR